MATRKIKDAIDLTTNEPIFFKGHAQATYMSDGTNVEDAVNSKVTKVEGKQLSTEDFTTALKNKLDSLGNYDDSALVFAVDELRDDFDKLVSGDTSTAIKTFNEIIAFLDGIQDTQDLSSIIASIEQQIAGKQATISDLATIRSGAAKGATAVQPADISEFLTVEDIAAVATTGRYEDLVNKPTIPAEQVNADWNATSGKAQILNKPTIPTAVTESTVSGWGFTKNTGTYSKPSSGIPKSDLASAVQSSLSKADTALQSETYKGTVTGVKLNGTTYSPSNGVVDLGTISGGSGGSGGSSAYPKEEILITEEGWQTVTLNPNTFYIIRSGVFVKNLTIEFVEPTDPAIRNEYTFILQGFDGTPVSLEIPSYWAYETPPEISNTTEISIVVDNNDGIWEGFGVWCNYE